MQRWTVASCIAGILAAVLILSGCRSSRDTGTVVSDPTAGAVLSAADLYVELTGPQSDDQGHYVALGEPGSVVVEGLVSGPEPPKHIYVNGAESTFYVVEQIEPWGAPAGYPVYRFRAPAVLTPTDDITVVMGDPYPDVEYVYVADAPATVARWDGLAAGNDPLAVYRLGSAYYDQANYAQAATQLERAVSGREGWAWTLSDLGMAYLALDRADDAISTFDRVTPLYAGMPDLYYERGLAYSTTGSYANAIKDLVQASDLVPNWAEPLLALGLTYYAQKELTQAVKPYERAIAAWPAWAPPYYALAGVRIDQDDQPDALRLINLGVDIGPWRAQHHLELARKLAAKGNDVAAWRQVQIARKLGGDVPASFVDDLRKRQSEPPDADRWPWLAKVEDDTRIPPGHQWAGPGRSGGQGQGGGPPGQAAGGPPGQQGGGQGQGGGPPEHSSAGGQSQGGGQGQGGNPPGHSSAGGQSQGGGQGQGQGGG